VKTSAATLPLSTADWLTPTVRSRQFGAQPH